MEHGQCNFEWRSPMLKAVVGLSLLLISFSSLAQQASGPLFAGLDLQKNGIDAQNDLVVRAHIRVRGAKITGIREPDIWQQVLFTEYQDGTYAVIQRDPNAGACRGYCDPMTDVLEEWLELEPLPTAGQCPGAACRIEITVKVVLFDRQLDLTTQDFTLRTRVLYPPQRMRGHGDRLIERYRPFTRPR